MLLVPLHVFDLLKPKAYKQLENSDADLSWLFVFKEANLSNTRSSFIFQLREYPCNITNDILFLICHGYF